MPVRSDWSSSEARTMARRTPLLQVDCYLAPPCQMSWLSVGTQDSSSSTKHRCESPKERHNKQTGNTVSSDVDWKTTVPSEFRPRRRATRGYCKKVWRGSQRCLDAVDDRPAVQKSTAQQRVDCKRRDPLFTYVAAQQNTQRYKASWTTADSRCRIYVRL